MALTLAAGNDRRELYILAVVCSYLGSFAVGMAIGFSAPAELEIKENFLTLDTSLFGSLLALGALCGGLLAGYLTEKFGRKGSILLLSPTFMLGWLFILSGNANIMLYLARFILGLACGIGCMAVPVYIGEVSLSERRGILGTGHQFNVVTAILVTFCLGATGMNYKWLTFCCMIPVVLMTISMVFMPESPPWMIKMQKPKSDIMEAIYFLYGRTVRAEAQFEILHDAAMETEGEDFRLAELVSPSVRRPLFLAMALMLFQQLSGVNAVIFYTTSIFESAGTDMSSSLESIIVSAVQVIFTVPAALLIDRSGRRMLLHISGTVQVIGLASLGLFYYLKVHNEEVAENLSWLPIASLSLYVAGFAVGYGPIPWLMMGELLPSRARGAGVGICTAFNWFCAFLVTNFFNNLQNAIGAHGCWWLFASIVLCGVIFVFLMIPETKGKTLEEIEAMFTVNYDATVSTVDSTVTSMNIAVN